MEKGTGSERSEVPVPFSNPRTRGIRVREGSPVPIERALLAERSQDGESEASIERAEGRMPGGSVPRDGTGEPEACAG
jgi:hypothetical protein